MKIDFYLRLHRHLRQSSKKKRSARPLLRGPKTENTKSRSLGTETVASGVTVSLVASVSDASVMVMTEIKFLSVVYLQI